MEAVTASQDGRASNMLDYKVVTHSWAEDRTWKHSVSLQIAVETSLRTNHFLLTQINGCSMFVFPQIST